MYIIKLFITGIVAIFKGIVLFVKYFFIGLFNVIIMIPKYFVIGIMTIFGKRKKVETSKQNKKLSLAIMGLSLTVYLICVFLISRWSVQKLKIKYLSEDIINSTEIIEMEENTENKTEPAPDSEPEPTPDTPSNNYYYPESDSNYLNINFNELLEKNSDTVGWIKVDGTKVNYPIVQAEDNDYYLSHTFDKSNNIAGWVFADYRVDFTTFGKNTIIYGHNMNNKTMFGSVPSMLKSSYLNNSSNYYIKISTPTCNTLWKVFSIYTIEPEVYYLKTNFRTEPFENFLNTIKGRSIYNFGIDVTPEDKILTLSTCDNTGTKRVAVHAKMISIEYK